MVRNVLTYILIILAIALGSGEAFAQTALGDQRVGTSSGSFLRIGVGARPVAMGGAYVAICDDITACAWNPAGLTHIKGSEIAVSYIALPADITYNHACYGKPIAFFDGVIALQFGSLSTELLETTEYHPFGTGRKFTFGDWLFGISVARRFTDRFSGGFAVKYVREELGVEVGGPVTTAFVLDAGTYYEIGPKNMRLAVALMNFGPDMTPSGSFTKTVGVTTSEALYQGFAPATEFKFGIAMEPFETPWIKSIVDFELTHPADNMETFRMGGEIVISDMLAIRAGHDMNADELKTSLGIGTQMRFGSRQARFDYAATLSDHLGTVHRFTLVLDL